ncbi:mannose-6-phosphate isomerase, class I [Vibrio cyclitrophicus]|uniref:mannose-6-phosphate isomerase, class I n=1 Tax=Vibrio cyclitrophicus TaxID=47951 RepID=UPI000C86398C|nr:mannose-6-phosphate isomerase, class I [Vibrio cyclitrophicus]PMH57590.1 mannose-6-phosphate isomerase, class I [Vibrio cyclitrophicus]
MIYKLKNVIQNYAWGSADSLSTLFGVDNPNDEPQAELWMGAHPNGCSRLEALDVSLSDYLNKHRESALGQYTATRYGELPYLFKVLAARTPLSIQVHPNKRNSELGFERENQLGIELTAGNRNYKDPNHKPELVYAITLYKAMNGFRPIADIIALFEEINIDVLNNDVTALKNAQNAEGLKTFFTTLLTLSGSKQKQALAELSQCYALKGLSENATEALKYSHEFSEYYPDDNGLLAPLFLNIVELKPGEAMFLHAETPHAYVQGTALEIMASSDNVLRAGLTPKHIDVEELVVNTLFEPISTDALLLSPLKKEGTSHFPVPVDDFKFDVVEVIGFEKKSYVRSAEIVFCLEGVVDIISGSKVITLKAGDSIFVPYSAAEYKYKGKGQIARVYN